MRGIRRSLARALGIALSVTMVAQAFPFAAFAAVTPPAAVGSRDGSRQELSMQL